MDPSLGFSAAVLAFLLLHPFVSLFAEASVIDHTTQLQALLAIKSCINFDPKKTLHSWNDSSNLCQWSGVFCDDRGQVSTLDLSGRGLRGTVSPSIGNLSSLRFLYLQDNQFSGELPLQIGGLLHLEALNVSSVSIGGAIPPSITRCSKLTTLDLSRNRISGDIPADVDRLSELRVLNLSQNSLTGTIPPTIGNLSFLHGLNLGRNQLRGSIPSDLGRLHKLQVLHLSINHFTGEIPPTLYNFSSLTNFELASNNLHGEIPGDIGFRFPGLRIFHACLNKFTGRIPPSLHNVTGLRSLRLSNNIITGPVPPGIENLRDLEMYEMSFNQIVSYGTRGLDFITSLTNSTKLGRINFNENRLEGIVPESVGNLSKCLTKLNLGGNYISGGIPASMGLLTNLELLNISHNSISGEIPKELGRLKRLIELNLNDNKLSGEIPADLGNLSQLSLLELNGNQLAGSIPATLGKLKDLMTLDASNNKLQGSIPRELFTLSRPRTVLNLSHNALTGSLPKEIGSLENVETIDLSANLLAGSIPNTVGKCRSLQILSMSKNHFSGPIPETLGDVKGLQSIDLSVNQLSGPIPVSLAKIHALHFLNLSFNDLEGNVPTEGVFATAAAHLQGNRKLCTSTFCESYGNRFSSRALLVVILVAAAVVLCLVGSIAFLVRRATTRAKIVAAPTLIKVQHPMISYQELHRATNGFDAGNLIGAGSFGSVYSGLLRDGAKVAVKVLKLETSRAMKSFSDECEALRNVRHRNLVKLVTVCMSLDFRGNDFRALVYELMGNGSLNEWIGEGRRRRGALSLVERLDVAIDVANALDYLHNYGKEPVVHRDVKPSNVLLDEEMTAKLGDFGLAKVLVEKAEGEESTTITHGLKGSIGYIPPEYGFGSKPSVKGDVYSYGVMLLELLTGKSPTDERFAGELSLVKWIRAAFPDELGKVLDEVLMGGAACVGFDGQQQISLEKKDECLASMIGIALSCVEESPDARLAMCDVLHQFNSTRAELMKSEFGIAVKVV